MMAAGRRLPGILHVDAVAVAALDFDPGHAKIKLPRRNVDHACVVLRTCAGDINHTLRQRRPFMRKSAQRLHLTHAGEEGAVRIVRREDRAVAVRLHGKVKARFVGMQLHTVPQVEVAVALRRVDLRPVDRIFVAIHERPEDRAVCRKLTRVNPGLKHRSVRLPCSAGQEGRVLALDHGDAAQRLGVAWRQAVPDAPDVFPALETCAVEEGVLQIVSVIASPTAADIHHMPRLQPFIAADAGDSRILPIAPALVVPGEHLIGLKLALGLQHQRLGRRVGGDAIGQRDARKRVAIDAIRADVRQQPRGRLRVGRAGVVRALIPRHRGKKYLDAPAMKIVDHGPDAGNASGQVPDEIVLAAGIDADVRIDGPDQDAVDTPVAAVKIVKVTVDRIAARGRIVEIAILHHHLRLNKIRLGPLQFGTRVLRSVIAHPDEALVAPVHDVRQPFPERGGIRRPRQGLAVGPVDGILREQWSHQQGENQSSHGLPAPGTSTRIRSMRPFRVTVVLSGRWSSAVQM